MAYAAVAGGEAFDSTGFKIGKRGAVKSPDASWVSQAGIDALAPFELTGFWPLSPDVAIEVKSAFDDFESTVAKVTFYRKHGSGYAVGIDPATRNVFELGRPPKDLVLDFDQIIGGSCTGFRAVNIV